MAAATSTTALPLPTGLARWSLPTNVLSIINPFAAPTHDDSPATPDKHATPASNKATASYRHSQPAPRRPILTALQLDQENRQAPSPTPSRLSHMFAEPDTRSNSDCASRDGSLEGRRRAKKSARPKTQFSICHPPLESKARQKLHRRPRSLLQLHTLSASARPRPALEVIPSANFSLRLTRAITKVFKSKHGLCPNDLVVLKAEKYGNEEVDDEQEVQDVVGLICRGRINDDKRMGKLRIHMASGREWEAYPAVNGGYEFFSTDEHGLGLMVRWVPKRGKDGGKSRMTEGKRGFNFSTISPNSRRHPVIASLSSRGLDINDTYRIPEPAAATPLSPPELSSPVEETFDEDGAGQLQCATDDQLRELITMTAIFVTFKEGWSPNFKYDDKDCTLVLGSPGKSGMAPTPFLPPDKRSSIKSIGSGILRQSSILSRSTRSSTASVLEEPELNEDASRSAGEGKPGRSRADSSSTVIVHRRTSHKRKNTSIATWRPDLLEQDPLAETTHEHSSHDIVTPSKTPVSPLARSASGAVLPKQNVAQPLIPIDPGSGTASPSPRSRTPVEDPELSDSHGESTATIETCSSSAPAGKTVASSQGKRMKRSRWRRILCGSKFS